MIPAWARSGFLVMVGAGVGCGLAPAAAAQRGAIELRADADPSMQLDWDRGVAGLVTSLRALRTTASLLHTTAHPDDEHAGLMTLLARGHGVRTSLLSLNRGEGGANAIGPELFDALGAIRTEELLLAGRYYGLEALYFTSAVDYGYSKTLEEAERSWDFERILEDMVRIIRAERPLVIVSRWHGSARDGHGHHQASGVLAPEAVRAAADPERFPDQIRVEGLRPWKVKRLFRGGVREGEPAQVAVETTVYAPWLGTTFQELASLGLSLQRSQTAGRLRPVQEPVVLRYEQLEGPGSSSAEDGDAPDFFAGLDTSLPGLFSLFSEAPELDAEVALTAADRAFEAAMTELSPERPTDILPHLAEALRQLRRARETAADAPESRFVLDRKLLQLQDALRLASGAALEATARPAGDPFGSLSRVVPGQRFTVELALTLPAASVAPIDLRLHAPDGWSLASLDPDPVSNGLRLVRRYDVRVPPDAAVSRPHFQRGSVRENHYWVRGSTTPYRPWSPPVLHAEATVETEGVEFAVRTAVRGWVDEPPTGARRTELAVLPRLSIRMDPSVLVLPAASSSAERAVTVELELQGGPAAEGQVSLEVPSGWSATPASRAYRLSRTGETVQVAFRVRAGRRVFDAVELRAVATLEGAELAETVLPAAHPDLEDRFLMVPARSIARTVDVTIASDLLLGYVPGVGDDIPSALAALGGHVEVLDPSAPGDDLGPYDAIVIGTRAYAVRPELAAANARLLDYVARGGHLIVLYQTPEYDPSTLAPHHAVLPARAEEVSEEDAPVTILAPEHPLLRWPNRITETDFEGWVEQRGSKFFSEWSPSFTPLIETHDRGQAPQRGVWLSAPSGSGNYSYVALALHRQTPYAVAGAYRVLANLVSLARAP